MNWSQFKDSVSSYRCLAGAVVSWSLTQEMAGLKTFTVMTDIFIAEFSKFKENI